MKAGNSMELSGNVKLLKIYIGEGMQHRGKSLSDALVLKAKELGLAGATVTKGIEGYGFKNIITKARIFDLSTDLPVIVEIVDKQEKIEAALPVFQEMVQHGLIITADVDVIKYGKKN